MPKLNKLLMSTALLLLGSALVLSAQTNGDPSVRVEDQELRNRVEVAEVVSDGQGWLVIHAEEDGAPGPVIGYRKVKDGVNKNVRVKIDKAEATDTLYAMLHADSGERGTFEFPDADAPVKVDGDVVMAAFQLER